MGIKQVRNSHKSVNWSIIGDQNIEKHPMSVDTKATAISPAILTSSPQAGVTQRISNRYLESRRKRIFDLLVASVGMIILAVFLIPVAIAIKIESKGPVFYRQRRLGLRGQPFMVIKFRTMVHNAESASGAVWRLSDDNRVTRLGSFLRKFYVDELTQFVNVIIGEMSVVGPRPERPELVDIIKKTYPGFDDRTMALPGITGLAQIKFPYVSSVVDSRRKLTYDALYIKNASLALDVWIVIRTVFRIIRRRGN